MTTETEERLRELENKNIEFEDEIQSLQEENSMLINKNKELLEIINLLNIRLKEMNALVYDFSRDKPQEEIMKTNADLIRELDKLKSNKMEIENELQKLKEAIEKRKMRTSKPEHKKDINYPNSPQSFDFDGDDNEIFGESFVIDSSNKELEERLRNVEEELRAAHQTIEIKEKNIAEMQETIEEMEIAVKSSTVDMKKSESFEMMNSETLKGIKGTLLQFLKKVPPTDKNNELLLNVLLDMLHMKQGEIREIDEIRKKLNSKDTPVKKKQSSGGLFSRILK